MLFEQMGRSVFSGYLIPPQNRILPRLGPSLHPFFELRKSRFLARD
jgi:hypothetical protein